MQLSRKLSLLLVIFYISLAVNAQDDLTKLLPVDQKVRIGKLQNGFTYYIRVNHKPEKRVEMRLAVNAGSILENDDQQGLAHLVEHMAFNGTTHFEKNELKNYLESIGMRFGPELNAYTSFDETVYMLTIPSDSVNLLDKGFLVMEDWAHGLTFDHHEIDKERGVVIEEWRLGQGYQQRMQDKFLPVLFQDSRYAVRLPIGKKEIIENCEYETLISFYRDWYRPDLMALIVVGDIDPDYAEKMIKEHFSKLAPPENVRERSNFDMPDHENTLVKVVSDPEAPMSMMYVFYKTDVDSQKTYGDYLHSLRYSFVTGLINQRLDELTELEKPPFIGAGFYYGGLSSRSKNALQGYTYFGENGLEQAMKALLTEAKRADEFGFTSSEFDRLKKDLMIRYETAYNERDKTESRNHAREYVSNYLDEEPIPGIEFEYEFVKNNIERITLEEINQLAAELIKEENRVIVVALPEKQEIVIPDEENVMAMVQQIRNSTISAYEDKAFASELMTDKPKPGKIVKETKIKELEAVDLTLSNGVRVILKPTILKNDEVLMTAFSTGGHSIYPDADHFTGLNTSGIVQESGVDGFAPSELNKILAGKSVYVSPSIGYETDQIIANAKSSDLEPMFQLTYLYFTNPRADRAAFNSYISKKKALFENLSKDPENFFYDKYYRFKAQNHPRGDYLPKPEDWNKVNFERAFEIYSDRFANAGEFTFIIVGAFDVEKIKPFLTLYVASLPVKKRTETYKDLGMRPPEEKKIENVYKGTDPKSIAILYFEKEANYNDRDAFMIGALNEVIQSNYVDILREEKSGVYTVRSRAAMQKIPYQNVSFQVIIPCAPENVDSLVHLAINELVNIQEHGVTDEDIVKVKETKRRMLETNMQNNRFWLNAIKDALMIQGNLQNVTRENYISQISSEELQRVAKQYFEPGRYLQVVMYPENYNKE